VQKNNKEISQRSQLLSLTSLTSQEFMSLLEEFDTLWQQQHQHLDLKGAARKLPKFKEHASMSLKGSYDKLMFVLIYLKQNPTQQLLGYLFGMSQGKVSQWLRLLLPLLAKALDRHKVLPSRCSHHLYATLRVLAGCILVLDGTERPVPRAVDYQLQQEFYSGKKNRHTIKNNLIIDKDKNVLYLSPTVEGSQHDKALADEMDLFFPPGVSLYQDLGFLGYQPEHVTVIMPVKKPKGGELTQQQKQFNKEVAAQRVIVEHVIGSIKRLRSVAEKSRLRIEGIYDQLMLIAVGLHNLRLTHRNLS
jgi:hypothetical protein